MDTNDYIGSFAQENVAFTTKVIKSVSVGDNYKKVMIFVENSRFVDSTTSEWTLVPNSTTIKALTVTADDYATYTRDFLQSWLYDLFANGFSGDCILVACTEDVESDPTAFNTAMETAYESLKAYAYHKTVCAGGATSVLPEIALKLATLCKADKGLLSSAPYFPGTNTVPADDPIYSAILADSAADAFISYHSDVTRNAALYALGIALAENNNSGSPVGNQLDMVATSNITASGASGTNLSTAIKTALSNSHIQYYKTVGDNSSAAAGVGAETIKGDVVAATWLVAYITYMSKVEIAKLMTTKGFYKNSASYTQIVNALTNRLSNALLSGRLTDVHVTCPSFEELPEAAADEIVINNAWDATYVDVIRKVSITGSLYIGA